MGTRSSWISLPLPLLLLSLAAQAQESASGRALVAERQHPQLDARAPVHDPDAWDLEMETRAWRGLYLNKSGLELRQPVQLLDRRFELGLKGPLMKRKRVGLAFELRF